VNCVETTVEWEQWLLLILTLINTDSRLESDLSLLSVSVTEEV